ncbi:MAG: hypothetical protein NXH82_11275 [Rhodobacteraceae bacterium]|nr:hypothetical protein [Paracoccaceae bacterium]
MTHRTPTLATVLWLAVAGLSATTGPLYAQSDPPGDSLRGMLDNLLREIEPGLRDLRGLADEARPALRDFLNEMGPALEGILAEIEDWSRYEPPEILPNGDILIRRKPDTPAPDGTRPADPDADGTPPVTEPIEL